VGATFNFLNLSRRRRMPNFDTQAVLVVKNALEEVMSRVPAEFSTQSTKAYFAEYLLKESTQGYTDFNGLFAAATAQIDKIASIIV
jgi:hypothetical protein